MGNPKKKDTMVDKNVKEELRLHDFLEILQDEKANVGSKVQEEQLNARFMSFYNPSKNKSRSDDDDGRNAVGLIDIFRSGKAPTFAAVGKNMLSQRARPAASLDIKAKFERAKRAMEDKAALLRESNADSSAYMNVWEEWMRDVGIIDKESSVAMWRYRNVSTTTKEFWRQIGRGDLMLGLRGVPFIYIEAKCSQTVELRVTTDVRVRNKTTQFDQERSTTLWTELCNSPAINNVLERVIGNGGVVLEGGERDVRFQIAMWGESYPDFNSAWERLKNAPLVSTLSNSEKNIVEVAVHQGVSISIEGFLFEANTHLPLNNNNAWLNNNGSQGITSDYLEWLRLSMENNQDTHNSIYHLLTKLSQNIPNTENNNQTLNYDNSCDSSRRSCLGVTQVPEVAQDCSAINPQRSMEPIALFSMSVTHHHTNSHQLQHFK